MYTLKELYRQGKQILTEAGLDSPAFDALRLLDKVFGVGSRSQLAIRGDEAAEETACAAYLTLIKRRRSEPLQYLLGTWEFDGMPLSVGAGVLVPREDTMALVEAAQLALSGRSAPNILDLCAGTGAVGLSLAQRLPDAHVTCVELSDEALPYLRRNVEAFGDGRVDILKADVLKPPLPEQHPISYDAIVANPPYIPAEDIASLQWEVRCEPSMALDGGEDGLDFYRAICTHWLPLLHDGSIIAVEIGYDIDEGVRDILYRSGVVHISQHKDFGGIDRCIFGTVISQ